MASVRKRTWTTSSGVQKSAWQVDYRDAHGRRRSKQFDRKKDADAWSVKARSEVSLGIHTPDSISITVSDAAALWLDSVRACEREITTIASYEQHVRLHIVPRCGSVKLSHLTAPKVRNILDGWVSDLSRAMATRVFRSFKALLTEAQERGLVAQNVALAVKMRKAPRPKSKITPPTKDEISAILSASAESDDLKGRALVELMIFSGMRASELRGVAWSAINMKEKTVTVERRADLNGTMGAPKSNAGFRTIALPDRVIATLKKWKLACPWHREDIVFPSDTGRVLSHGIMTKNHLNPIMIAAGVTKAGGSAKGDLQAKYSAHAFRHAAASLWIAQGLNPKRVQNLMGHSSIQMTFDTYGHLFDEAQKDREDANAIERALYQDVETL